jgi:hypothetical protein
MKKPTNFDANSKLLIENGIPPIEIPSSFYPQPEYKNDRIEVSHPQFTLSETPGTSAIYITHKSGATAEIYQQGESWLARNLTGADSLTEKRKEGLLKRMGEWYYHTHVKK